MKISKVQHHGKTRYRVNDSQGNEGKRQRKFFETREAAESYVSERNKDTKTFGVHYSTIPQAERAVIAYHIDKLKQLGWTLPDAVNFIAQHGKAAPSLSLGKVADELFVAKDFAGLRPRYVRTLKASIKRFLIGRGDKLAAEITPAEIQEYISSNGWGTSTMRSYLVDVRTLFAFALKRKYVRENPALAVDLPKVDDKPAGIVTPEQGAAILDAAIDYAPDSLPVFALQLFGALRRSEAELLDWTKIKDDFVEVTAVTAKKRHRRLVPISPQLAAWLKTGRDIGGKLPSINYADKLKRVLDKAGLRQEWPQNALRHSFASYHVAKHKNVDDTATMMGNSPQMIFEHYREIVRPADAEKFFALMPPADAVQRAEAARKKKPRVMPPRESKITPPIMAEIFGAGRLTLTRKEAVAALMARVGCSVAAAYNALAPEGRFKAALIESDGKLTWQSETTALVAA